jgi:hypothetical protein
LDELAEIIFKNNWRNYPWWMNFPRMIGLFQSFVSPFYNELQEDIQKILKNTFVNARCFPKFSKDKLSNGSASFWMFDKSGMLIFFLIFSY